MEIFSDLKRGFGQVVADPQWRWKIVLGGVLLINPFLLVGLLMRLDGRPDPAWLDGALWVVLGVNVLTFWFPLGFTYEVLRRAVTGGAPQLPEWEWRRLGRYAREGSVKLVLAVFTLIVPIAVWVGAVIATVKMLGLPPFLIGLMVQPVFLVTIPFCAVACCRWLDGASVWDSALNYVENARIFRARAGDFLLASLIVTGFNTVACSFFVTIPFAAVFGLCLVDTWFGPIYRDACRAAGTRTIVTERLQCAA